MRQLDPLFGGLSREARILQLPIYVFLSWLMLSTFIGVALYLAIHWSLLFVWTLSLYGVLKYLTFKEDKGVSYFFKAKARKMKHYNPQFEGVSYDPYKKNVKNLDFQFAREAMKESTEAERIPYLHHVTPEIIKLVNGDLLTVIKVAGIKYETEGYHQLEALKTYRNTMLMQLGERCIMYVHYVRQKAEPAQYKPYKNPLTDKFLQGYTKNINQKKRFTNDIYVSLVIRSKDPNGNALSGFFKGNDDKHDDKLINELNTSVAILKSQLDRYEPKQLTIKQSDNGFEYCETLGFLSYILNLDSQAMPYLTEEIKDYLSDTRKVFKNNGNIIFNKSNGESRIACMFGVPTNGWAQGTDHQMIDPFLSIPNELVITMSFAIMNREASRKIAKDKQGYLEASEDDAISQIVDIDQVRDDIASGKLLNGMFNMSVMLHAKDADEFKSGIEAVRTAFSQNGIHPRKEDMIAEPAYYAQLPGNYRYSTRASVINTNNYAGFASMHNSKQGKKFGNHWREKKMGDGTKHIIVEHPEMGDYVLELMSTSNTPYYFNFHSGDTGHTRIGAPTGGGKTVLINALLTASTKYNPYIFHFDFEYSAAPFIRAMGGYHKDIMPTSPSGWNPLQLPDTPENRAFIYRFISYLATKRNKDGLEIPLQALESQKIQDLIENIYEVEPEYRRLRHFLPFLGMAQEDNLAQRLGKWCNDGAYSALFDNETVSFNIKDARFFGFETKHIIADGEVFPAVLMYLMHRIDISMTEREPFLLVFEEGQRLVQNPYLMSALKIWLTTIRRRNGLVVFVTPTLEVLTKDDDLRQQFKTSIFFPNDKASYKTYVEEEGLGCTEKEFNWIASTDPKSRQFLIKTEHDSVVSKLDMTGLTEFLELFSGTDAKNAYIDELEAVHGKNPSAWIPKFIEKFSV